MFGNSLWNNVFAVDALVFDISINPKAPLVQVFLHVVLKLGI